MNRDKAAEDDILVHRFGRFTYLGLWLQLAVYFIGVLGATAMAALTVVQGIDDPPYLFNLPVMMSNPALFVPLLLLGMFFLKRVGHTIECLLRIHDMVRKHDMVELGPLKKTDPNTGGDPHLVDDPDSIFFRENFMPYCICPGCHVEALHWMHASSVDEGINSLTKDLPYFRGYNNGYDGPRPLNSFDVIRTCRFCGTNWGQNLLGTPPLPLQGPALPTKDEYPIGSEPKDITIPWEQYVQADKDLILAEARIPPPVPGTYSWATSEGIWHDQPLGPRRNREN